MFEDITKDKVSQGSFAVLRRTLAHPGGTLPFKERVEGERYVEDWKGTAIEVEGKAGEGALFINQIKIDCHN